MPRLQSAKLASLKSNPAGPGVLIRDLAEFTPAAVKAAINGDQSMGYMLGAMTSAPSVSVSRDVNDRTEDLVGLNASFRNAQKMMRTDVTVDASLVQLTHANIPLIHPGLSATDWMSATTASLTIGTGNAAFRVRATTGGVAANTTTVTVVTPSGSATTATYAAPGLSITPKTGETAQGLIDALYNHPALVAAGVQIGLPATSDGSGTVVAAVSAPLAGGAAGAKIGRTFNPKGFFSDNDYWRNAALCLEGDTTDVLQIFRVDNPISSDDLDISPDDEGGITSIDITLTGSVTESNFDPVLGNYIPPYAWYNLDLPA